MNPPLRDCDAPSTGSQLFALQARPHSSGIAAEDAWWSARFEDVHPIGLGPPNTNVSAGLRVLAGRNCKLTFLDLERQGGDHIFLYLWGEPAHPYLPRHAVPKWIAEAVEDSQYARLKELLGTFVVMVDEPCRRRITIATDVLGIRPMFIGRKSGRFFLGSDAWALLRAGLSTGHVNYDAIAAWIAFGFNCTHTALFADLQRLPPGAAVVIDGADVKSIPFAAFAGDAKPAPLQTVAAQVHDAVKSAVAALLREHPHICIPLSGGYDSRYLLALSLSLLPRDLIDCVTVCFSDEEKYAARQVAAALEQPMREFEAKGAIWDLYSRVFHFAADGFPISKFVTHYLADQVQCDVMMNGFMGDSLVRGSKDTFQGKYESQWEKPLQEVLFEKHTAVRLDLFTPAARKHIVARARAPMEEAVREGSKIDKVFGWADFYFRQRLLISNNFLGHLHQSEAMVPFYNWKLLSYKMNHDYRSFGRQVYSTIFEQQFPSLASIPHADDLPTAGTRPFPVARSVKRWVPGILVATAGSKWLSIISRDKAVKMAAGVLLGMSRAQEPLFTLKRIHLLEQCLAGAHLELDWSKM